MNKYKIYLKQPKSTIKKLVNKEITGVCCSTVQIEHQKKEI